MSFRAFIFDMDGTIVDNMAYHDQAWDRWHLLHELPFDSADFFARTAGRANREILGEIFPAESDERLAELAEEKEELYRALYAPNAALLAGLVELMAEADARGVAMAVATAAPPANIPIVLDALRIRERFATLVAPSQGFRGKPHPDMFLAAAERMKAAPADCVVFEDAPLGVEAARRAGMKAVALLTTAPAPAFAGFDNLIAAVPDFTALDRRALFG